MKRLLILCCIAIVSTGCSQLTNMLASGNDDLVYEGKVVIDSSDVIFPLKVGIEWTYRFKELDSAGNELFNDTASSYVAKDTVVSGERWYFFASMGSLLSDLGANRDDGYWSRKIEIDITSGTVVGMRDPYLASKYPAAVGDTFSNDSDYVSLVRSIDSIITVPAGVYECYVYLRTSPTAKIDSSFIVRAPRVGTIYREDYTDDANGVPYLWRTLELTATNF